MFKPAIFILAAGAALASAASAGDRDEFYGMCHRVSLGDGLDDGAASSFCSCLADKATESGGLYAELYEAGVSEPDPEARMTVLSNAAKSAVASCQ